MVQRRGEPGVTFHPLERFGRGDRIFGQKLERYLAPEADVLGAVDDTERVSVELLEKAIVRDGEADQVDRIE